MMGVQWLEDLDVRRKIIQNSASGGKGIALELRTRTYSPLQNTNLFHNPTIAFHWRTFTALTHSLCSPARAMCCIPARCPFFDLQSNGVGFAPKIGVCTSCEAE
jgi:hypothetical protein